MNNNNRLEIQLGDALLGLATEISTEASSIRAIPPASILWLRAQLRRRRLERERDLRRATRPLQWMYAIGITLSVIATAVLTAHTRPSPPAAWIPAVVLLLAACAYRLHLARSHRDENTLRQISKG